VGERGERGETGQIGPEGSRGETGVKGDRGERGEPGPQGVAGHQGSKGDRGEPGPQGEKGEQGEVGVAAAIYPLKLEDKTLSVEQKFFQELIETSAKGYTAQSSGGGNVDIFVNGEKVVKNLRSLNFTDGFVVTQERGNKLTLAVDQGATAGISSLNGLTGAVSITAGNDIVVTTPTSSTIQISLASSLDGGSF
jgi:hypothetical protein